MVYDQSVRSVADGNAHLGTSPWIKYYMRESKLDLSLTLPSSLYVIQDYWCVSYYSVLLTIQIEYWITHKIAKIVCAKFAQTSPLLAVCNWCVIPIFNVNYGLLVCYSIFNVNSWNSFIPRETKSLKRFQNTVIIITWIYKINKLTIIIN